MSPRDRDLKAETPVPDDHALLARLRADPSSALPVIVTQYQRPLLRHARAVLMDASAAEDVVQESFLRLLSSHEEVQNLGGWLHRVTHNLALDYVRREGRRRRLLADAVPTFEFRAIDSAAAEAEHHEAVQRVEAQLEHLSANERAVLFLKIKDGRSYKEISAITGLSVSNVGYLIHHALRKLAERVREAQ